LKSDQISKLLNKTVSFAPNEAYHYYSTYIPETAAFAHKLKLQSSVSVELFGEDLLLIASRHPNLPTIAASDVKGITDAHGSKQLTLSEPGRWNIAICNPKYVTTLIEKSYTINGNVVIPIVTEQVLPLHIDIPYIGQLTPQVPYQFLATTLPDTDPTFTIKLKSRDAVLIIRRDKPFPILGDADLIANEGNIKSLVVEGSGSLYVTIYDALYKQRKQAEPFKIVIESSNNNDSLNSSSSDLFSFRSEYPQQMNS
jgi:hypothetical protein